MTNILPMNRISVDDFEKFHAQQIVRVPQRATLRELVYTLSIALFMAPFTAVTFMVIPIMGQVTVFVSLSLTLLYLYFRRSVLVAMAAGVASLIFWVAIFVSIQAIKNRLEVPLFFFTATGIPVSAMYSMFIGARIWIIRGGVD